MINCFTGTGYDDTIESTALNFSYHYEFKLGNLAHWFRLIAEIEAVAVNGFNLLSLLFKFTSEDLLCKVVLIIVV